MVKINKVTDMSFKAVFIRTDQAGKRMDRIKWTK